MWGVGLWVCGSMVARGACVGVGVSAQILRVMDGQTAWDLVIYWGNSNERLILRCSSYQDRLFFF